MDKIGNVFFGNVLAGYIAETDEGYEFEYNQDYLLSANSSAISLTLPLQKGIYKSKTLFPFFDGLIPEGWLLAIAIEHWKIKSNDRFQLLLATCHDTIGAVSVMPKN
jgi:serine/threonine-protein kinase HipA